jgi:hypothetical protein
MNGSQVARFFPEGFMRQTQARFSQGTAAIIFNKLDKKSSCVNKRK